MKRSTVFKIVGGLLCAVALVGAWKWRGNPDVLWQIVSRQCVPDQNQHHNPSPCLKVDPDKGYALLKDLNGPYQDLLIPTDKITGIEDIALTRDLLPHYFAQAWKHHDVLSAGLQTPIADRYVSLAINSRYGRTQNQLHIHISCLLPAVKQRLAQVGPHFIEQWQPLPGGLLGHDYLGRRVTPAELEQQGAFRLLASGLPRADGRMGSFGLAMTALPDGDFLLLATERSLLPFTLASAEEIQDHDCRLLTPPPRA